MPHDKNGREIALFDEVMAPVGYTFSKEGKHEPTLKPARVIGLDKLATCCELTLLVGGGELLGTVNLPSFDNRVQPKAGVILSGYYTSCNAKDVENISPLRGTHCPKCFKFEQEGSGHVGCKPYEPPEPVCGAV